MASIAGAPASLPSLPGHVQSDTGITSHLASRFHAAQPWATLSGHGLVAVNTYSNAAQVSTKVEVGKLGEKMLLRLRERGENQSAIFLGESGSGKTTLRALLLANILDFSRTPLSHRISVASFLFDTFTTTKTATTPTSSKAGLFVELQYDTSATLIGASLLAHRLERGRISAVPTGERNYHILYYLLAGTSPSEKRHLALDGSLSHQASSRSQRWRYLGHPTQMKVGIDDAGGFSMLTKGMRTLGFSQNEIAEMMQILAAILHIGQLEFTTGFNSTVAGDESTAIEGGEECIVVRNKEVLGVVAAFLGVAPELLQTTLGYKTKTIRRERVTVLLDAKGAKAHADELARTLYALLVAWLVENVNDKIGAAEDSVTNTISIVDFPGFQAQRTTSTLDQLLTNTANEALVHYYQNYFFSRQAEQLEAEEVGNFPATSYYDNSDCNRALTKPGNGLLAILDDQMRKGRSDQQFHESIKKRFIKNPSLVVGETKSVLPGANFHTTNKAADFTIRHYAGTVEYPVAGLIEEDGEVISGDIMSLFGSTTSSFLSELVGGKAMVATHHPRERTAIMQGQVSSMPLRQPSVMRKKGRRPAHKPTNDEDDSDEKSKTATVLGAPDQGAAGQYASALETVIKSLSVPNSNPYFVFCLKANDRRISMTWDSKVVRTQIQSLGIAELSGRLKHADFSIFLPFAEFIGLSEAGGLLVGSDKEKAENIISEKNWPGSEARAGATGVFLSEACWADIANPMELRRPGNMERGTPLGGDTVMGAKGDLFGSSRVKLIESNAGTPMGGQVYSDKDYFASKSPDNRSEVGGDMFKGLDTREQILEKGQQAREEEIDEVPVSSSRKRWMAVVYLLTWFIPDFAIRLIGGIKRKDVRTAWREKLAINMLIWLSCAAAIFILVIFPWLICPTQHVYSTAELTTHAYKENPKQAWTAIRGEVFDLTNYASKHYPQIVKTTDVLKYGGMDATAIFPVQVNALCQGKDGTLDDSVQLNYVNSSAVNNANVDKNAKYHDFRTFTNDSRPDWYYEQMIFLRANFKKGDMGYSKQYIKTLAGKQKSIAIIHDNVYDLTDYIAGNTYTRAPVGKKVPAGVDVNFMDQLVVDLFQQQAGADVSKFWDNLPLKSDAKARMATCLRNLFFVGRVDTRNSAQCLFARYILLAITILLVSVIGFKFFAALQFGRKTLPENLDKFIICQVPAYTEDEDSLRRAIDSLAKMRYDDKRKLLVVICDGMIIGTGNDRPTPRIVLDILGVGDNVDPEPLSFESLGEGMKQHNMGKVYSGLYEVQGHIVPFVVVVKVGKPSEVQRPGNRGKRDSQMILMRFLNRVHYNHPMSPLELEIHHQIRNVIGVNPTFYEYLLQIDADTIVAPDSATRMVAACMADTRIIGLCGETALDNAKHSFITMIQVYEYYISHNLSKAFESLFGSVTCLPGCFSMYRIRQAESGKPLFVSREVVDAYAEIRVDTLHMKNLLHLGEDRYLTTLLLKHHPKFKTKFIFNAHAWTIAPDSWKVFMSQRRRWINSTVHNLMELIPMQQLCGFCCFSMRFVVFLDLLSTIIGPVTVAYIAYLIYLTASGSNVQAMTAFILLGAIYGLQGIIFILRRKWEMIGWMILYILAIPVFSFGLPLYAFWHMDDFSWGNTRIVMGEKGQKVIISDEGKFDPNSIPKKKWEDFQTELWEQQTSMNDHADTRSELSGYSYATKSAYPHSDANRLSHIPPPQLPTGNFGTSRYSLAPSEMMQQSTRGSQLFLGGGQTQDVELVSLELPSDDALLAEIRQIIATADLMTVTKKSIKSELERRFGVSLDAKKAYINSATEAILSGRL